MTRAISLLFAGAICPSSVFAEEGKEELPANGIQAEGTFLLVGRRNTLRELEHRLRLFTDKYPHAARIRMKPSFPGPVFLFGTGTWMADRFHPLGRDQEMYDSLKAIKGGKKKCLMVYLPPDVFMETVWDRLSRLGTLVQNRILLAPYQPEPRRQGPVPRPENPVNLLPASAGQGAPTPEKTGREFP
ncbi:hypothetical protein [uncultured Akkermansia sp.]|uniref:hypothetical protein n=1 Tax=uncultured Akkermansia sp. TaxID=512294 RepID=UPI0025D20A19|nr:hypothetical protein [uncultured Akkermansia sp.]